MRQYFNTKEAAQRNLEVRRKSALKRIEKLGWKVLGDSSFVHADYRWKGKQTKGGSCYAVQTKELKWYKTLMIVTDEMMKDLKEYQSFNWEEELVKAIKNEKNT
jgi:hypothetical protein